MTLAVVTLQFGALPYFDDSAAINAAYCARHGFSWDVCEPTVRADRSPVWSKIDIVIGALRSAETVVFLDADAVFVDHESEPGELLDRLGKRALLFGLDRSGQANTGVFLARRSDTTTRILEQWRHVPERDSTHAFRWPLEQGALNRHVIGRWPDAIALPSRAELDFENGAFIRHFAARPLARKTQEISRLRALL